MTDDQAWERQQRLAVWAEHRAIADQIRAKQEDGEISPEEYRAAIINNALDCAWRTLPYRVNLP